MSVWFSKYQSSSLMEIVGGPRTNESIVLIACATTTFFPLWSGDHTNQKRPDHQAIPNQHCAQNDPIPQ
ncbi:MAG: hypothetical protein DMG14_32390 [Acidobacteria bacterium]|nr:MAG: hypothetical protein DMG14_32390 [Acidobacteriota bacterium]